MKDVKVLYLKRILFIMMALFTLLGFTFGQEALAKGKVTQNHLEEIITRGYLLVGTTGDFKPMSYYDVQKSAYEGFDIEASKLLADSLGVEIRYVKTTWPTLMQDMLDGKFDIAMSGITKTFARQQKADLSHGYITFGKTALMRAADIRKYPNLAVMNNAAVRVGVNPGGTNENFVRENLPNATIITHQQNAEIPGLVASGEFDVMITDSMEAVRYIKDDIRLSAPLLQQPFTKNRFGIMMKQGDQTLLNYVNMWMEELELQGTFERLENKYLS